MVTKYDWQSVGGAKNRLDEINMAKDFLQGSQEEFPHKYDHFQRQIDDLTNEENDINSWLGTKPNSYGGAAARMITTTAME